MAQFVGLSRFDQLHMKDLYQCKKALAWTDRSQCVDYIELGREPLDCKSYVDQGRCSRDPKPCCACNKWNSGFPSRIYNDGTKTEAECKDER